MHVLAVFVKEGRLFAWDLSLENYEDYYLFLIGFTSFVVLLFFPQSTTVFVFVDSLGCCLI